MKTERDQNYHCWRSISPCLHIWFNTDLPCTAVQTYNTNMQVTDSAASSTAYLSGVKGNQATIGVDANVQLADCVTMNEPQFHTKSILADFQVLVTAWLAQGKCNTSLYLFSHATVIFSILILHQHFSVFISVVLIILHVNCQDDQRSTGIVTTTRVTHASPAGTYAHTAERSIL